MVIKHEVIIISCIQLATYTCMPSSTSWYSLGLLKSTQRSAVADVKLYGTQRYNLPSKMNMAASSISAFLKLVRAVGPNV